MLKVLINIIFLLYIHQLYAQIDTPFTTYVNPYIGTEGEGNVFAGATRPFGMVKLGPDCDDLTSNSGFKLSGKIKGFSHTHVSGTGGGPKYGNVLLSPFTGRVRLDTIGSARENEIIQVGKYQVRLSKYNIQANLTTSHSVGFHEYTFPKSDSAKVLIDLGSLLETSWCEACSEEQELVGSEIEIVNDSIIEGYTRVRKGWNTGEAYTVYFSALFNTAATGYGTWKNNHLQFGKKIQYDTGASVGGWFEFETQERQKIRVKVGISFLSTLKARQNIKQEIPHWDIDSVIESSKNEWNDYLSKLQVKTDRQDLKEIFYTGLYHSLIQPTNRTGENPLWSSSKPYYDDYYAIWDTFRVTHPLFTLICPDKQKDIVNSLIDIYNQEGYMPDARSGNQTGRTQGGSNCDVLIADAFVKDLKGIDYENALTAMIANAENDPGIDHQKKGRGGLQEYNQLGYVSTNHERAGTRTLEYAYNDYCIYQVAKGLEKNNIASKYLKRSNNWENLWKEINDGDIQGFIMPKKENGLWDETYKGREWNQAKRIWEPSDFTVHSHGTWPDFFYEADSWEYSFYVPHDIYRLIEKSGGKNAFIKRLDVFFTKNYYNVGNEPSFLTPTLYNFVKRQDKSNELIRSIIKNNFTNKKDGIPGNDDSGSMSSWVAFNLMGLYPNAGQNYYLITAPHFDEVELKLQDGKLFKIQTQNLNENNIYIENVLLNGNPLNRSWITHQEILNGGELLLIMRNTPSNSWEKELPTNQYPYED